VGPPIWVRDPPNAEIKKPATTAVYKPACGGTPDAMAKPYGQSGDEIVGEFSCGVAVQALDGAGDPLRG
jgi:hypothetical protein